MRARWMTALATAAVLAVPATAQAGGWATVELSSTPQGLQPGEPWVVDVTVLQHGQRPLDDVRPQITVTSAAGGDKQTVAATPTGRTGVYRAEVTFPRAGRWEYVVDDGFSQRHEYPAVQIGGATPAAGGPTRSGEDSLWPAVLAALAAGLAAAGLTAALRRRRRDHVASAEG